MSTGWNIAVLGCMPNLPTHYNKGVQSLMRFLIKIQTSIECLTCRVYMHFK